MPASNIARSSASRPPSMSGSPAPRMTFVASSTVPNSLRGMPIMSQMTSSGNGCDSACDEVDLALLAHVVDHLGADRLDRVEHALRAAAGVNDRATMPRWRAWRGSSMLMNEPKNSSASAGMSGIDTAPWPEQKSCGPAADLDHLGVAGDRVEASRSPRSSGCRTRRGRTGRPRAARRSAPCGPRAAAARTRGR